jgi:hypothetical protein
MVMKQLLKDTLINNIMRIRNFIIAGLLMATMGCNKNVSVPAPVTFDVASSKNNGNATTVFSAKDTVLFHFTGDPNIITFYSGEVGKRYNYANRISAPGDPQLQFNSILAAGTQPGSLSLLVSTNFKGVATNTIYGVLTRDTATTNANIAAATWTDITSRATLSTGAATSVPSGIVDLADQSKGKPVYIAFKYTATAGSIQNKWTISALTLNNVLADGTTYTIANLAAPTTAITNYGNISYGPGWAVSYNPAKDTNNYAWIYTAGTSLVITGAATAALATAPVEAWAIIGPIDLTKVTPDAGLGIKDISAALSSYSYIYTAAGNYNAVFVASNNTTSGTNATVTKIALTINP